MKKGGIDAGIKARAPRRECCFPKYTFSSLENYTEEKGRRVLHREHSALCTFRKTKKKKKLNDEPTVAGSNGRCS